MQTKTALHHKDSKDLLGFIVQDSTDWQAQTVFGYSIARVETKAEAEKTLRQQGFSYLQGIWQYYDAEDHDWHACTIKDANEHAVTVIRTNALGYIDPDDFKHYTITDPSEEKLVKSS